MTDADDLYRLAHSSDPVERARYRAAIRRMGPPEPEDGPRDAADMRTGLLSLYGPRREPLDPGYLGTDRLARLLNPHSAPNDLIDHEPEDEHR